jgi:thiol-disulfide isomerase/thioredoxin
VTTKPVRRPRASQRSGPRPRRAPRRRIWLSSAPLAAGIAAAALFAVLSTEEPETRTDLAFGRVSVSGEPLPEYAGGTDDATGMAVPEITGQTFDGTRVLIAGEGRPMAIVFLAHWCPHCQREVDDLGAWFDQHGVPGEVDLYSVVTLTDPSAPNYPPASWLQQEGWPLPVLVDDEDSSAASAFGLSGTPFWVFADSEGRIVLRASGEMGGERLQGVLSQLA